jgi:hypothetical protein
MTQQTSIPASLTDPDPFLFQHNHWARELEGLWDLQSMLLSVTHTLGVWYKNAGTWYVLYDHDLVPERYKLDLAQLGYWVLAHQRQ